MIVIASILFLCNVGTCFSMAPHDEPKQLNFQTQMLISDADNKEAQAACPGYENKQLRLLFDLETNCLYCTFSKGMVVEKSFPLPFHRGPAQAVTDVRVYGFDFIKPGIIFAIILAKKRVLNDSAFFMSIDLAKKLHIVWPGESAGSFTEFTGHLMDRKKVEIIAESRFNNELSNRYSRSKLEINYDEPNRPMKILGTVSANASFSVK